MIKKITLYLLLLLVNLYVNAQKPERKEVTISGRVIDKETKQPLEYATISFFSIKQDKIVDGGITNTKGYFSIPVVTGKYIIKIEYISFETITIEDKLLTKNENLGVFNLELDAQALDAVEIIAEKTTVEIKLDKKIYNVGKDLTVSGGNVTDVLDNVPSVSVDADGSIALRGNEDVRILINGKPSGLVGLNSTEALQQLPAESIEKIEVITSPSARYDAEGAAGIINIILRRSKLQGLNGSATTNIGYPNMAGISTNINYRTGDINIFNTTTYRYIEILGRWYNDVKYFDENTPDLDEKRDWVRTRNGITTNTGVEWYITKSTSLTNSMVIKNNNTEENSVNRLTYFNKIANETTTIERLSPDKGDNKTIQYALNFNKNFKTSGHTLSLDFQLEDSNQDKNNIIRVNTLEKERIRSLEDESNILLQSDYVLPIGQNSQIELGYRGNFRKTVTNFEVFTKDETNANFIMDNAFSGIFNFKQHINALYGQFGSKINKFSYLLGLRYEGTNTTLEQASSNYYVKEYLNGLFPSINLNYEFSERETLTLGYNRRLRRPRGFMLNPFPSRSSTTNVFQGNPDLNPAFTGTYELGYLNRFEKFTLSTSIYYSQTVMPITFASKRTGEFVTLEGDRIPEDGNDSNGNPIPQSEKNPVIERGPLNVNSENRIGYELNLTYKPSKKWRVNTDFNIFRLKRKGTNKINDTDVIDLSANNVTWRVRLTNKLTLPYNIDWQTNIRYRAANKDAQNNRRGLLFTNTALSKDLFNEKASVAFNIRDIFNTAFYNNQINTETFTAVQEIQFRGGRTFNLSFTYRFNQKKKRERDGYEGDSDGDDL